MTLPAAGRLKLLAGTVLALTFVAGGLGGAFLYRELHDRERERQQAAERREPECPQQRTEADERRRALWPYQDLGLTDEQADRIWAAVEANRRRMDSIWQSTRPQMDSLVQATRATIRSYLTPEQQEKLDARRAERARRDSIRREEHRRRCGEQSPVPDRRNGRGERGR